MRASSTARLSLTGILIVFAAMSAQAENAAHMLAEKFSHSDAKVAEPDDDAQRKAYEAEMLERARQEARDRADAESRAAAEAEARIKDMEAQREAEAQALADKLKRAELARRSKTVETFEEKPFKPALTITDKAAKPAAGTASAPIVITPPAQSPAVFAKDAPPAVAPAVVGPPPVPLKPADVAKETGPSPIAPVAASPSRAPTPEPPMEIAREPSNVLPPPMALGRSTPVPPVAVVPADPRVTVLLVMEPGTKGIRRFNKTADPVLCEGQLCFVSNGSAMPARVMALRKALGPGNTFGKRAGACRGKLACVFRSVTLAGSAPTIQPVDLKVLVHDRREPMTVSGDASCQVIAGRLSCGRMVVARGYRAWIVPELIADAAGPAALDSAVLRGLVAVPMREASVRE